MAERERLQYAQWTPLVLDFHIGAEDVFIEATTRVLNERGEEGWELVSVFPVLSRQDIPYPGDEGPIQRPVMVPYIAKRRIRQ